MGGLPKWNVNKDFKTWTSESQTPWKSHWKMAKYPCPMYWNLYYMDISVLMQRYSVVPPDNKNKDDEYNICGRPSEGPHFQESSEWHFLGQKSIKSSILLESSKQNSLTSCESISWFHSDNLVYFFNSLFSLGSLTCTGVYSWFLSYSSMVRVHCGCARCPGVSHFLGNSKELLIHSKWK